MKKLFSGTSLYITFGILAAVILVAAVVLIGVGRAYKGGLASLLQKNQEAMLVKRKQVNRITFKKSGGNACIEVTPDGVVRVYKECGGELTEARRLDDMRNINLLFQAMSLQDESLYRQPCTGECYEVTIETDEGTQTLYIQVGGGGAGGSIGDLIDDIEEQATATPTPSPGAPIASPTPGESPLPTPTLPPGESPQPSVTPGTGGESTGTFVCDFLETSNKKPYRVSGIVCTTEPSPIP